MTTISSSSSTTVELAPSYKIPLALIIIAIAIIWVQLWLGLGIALFGLFLSFQTATLRLRFTETDLDIYRSERLIRRFPYQDWNNWQIFWEPIPILFYFREVKSIHFLPILFDARALKETLETRIPRSPSS